MLFYEWEKGSVFHFTEPFFIFLSHIKMSNKINKLYDFNVLYTAFSWYNYDKIKKLYELLFYKEIFMKEIKTSEERNSILIEMALTPDEKLEEKGYKKIAALLYPRDYDGERHLCDLYKVKKDEFVKVDKVVHYFCLWCTGDNYVWEYSIENMDELLNEKEMPADYARIIEYNNEKILVVCEFK